MAEKKINLSIYSLVNKVPILPTPPPETHQIIQFFRDTLRLFDPKNTHNLPLQKPFF